LFSGIHESKATLEHICKPILGIPAFVMVHRYNTKGQTKYKNTFVLVLCIYEHLVLAIINHFNKCYVYVIMQEIQIWICVTTVGWLRTPSALTLLTLVYIYWQPNH